MSKNFIDMVIGNLLGDAHISRTGLDKAYITFEQAKKKVEYINYLHKLSTTENLVSEEIRKYTRYDIRYNKFNESLYFLTNSEESLNFLAKLFLDKKGKKIIPSNISEYLTIRSLAFWIMDDGQQVKRGGVTLCTDSYKSEEISKLRQALEINFNLITSVHKKVNKSNDSIYERIYISKTSLDEIKPLLKEHMHESMFYKINERPDCLIEPRNT